YERQLEVELAKRSPVSESAATSSEQPEPVEESVKQPRASTAQIRAWAKEQGLEVPARGSLPSDVVDAYHKAHAEYGGVAACWATCGTVPSPTIGQKLSATTWAGWMSSVSVSG